MTLNDLQPGLSLDGEVKLLEQMKEQARFLEPDLRSLSLVRIDLESGPRRMTVADQYEVITRFELHAGVPDEVRSYFESVKTLCLYAFMYYPFYSMIPCYSVMAVELALRYRLPQKGKGRRALKNLLDQAIAQKIIAPNNSLDVLRRIRNDFVHASSHSILSPGLSLPIVKISTDLINALWPQPATQAQRACNSTL